jgi:hypothetical protein
MHEQKTQTQHALSGPGVAQQELPYRVKSPGRGSEVRASRGEPRFDVFSGRAAQQELRTL